MNLNKLYHDIIGSVGGRNISPRMLFRLITKNPLFRLIHFLKTEIFYGRVVNSIKRQQQPNMFLPKSIVIEPTYQCNLACDRCYTTKNDITMSHELFEFIIDSAEKIGIYRFVLMGGEPTLENSIKIMLPSIRKHKNSSFLFCTNGTLIKSALLKDFENIKNVNFIISSEGTKQHTDKRRGAGVYEKIVNGMKLLKTAKIGFATSVTLYPSTWEDQIPESFFETFVKSGGVVVYTYFIFNPEEKQHDVIDKIKYFDYLNYIVKKYPVYIGDGQFGKVIPKGIIPRSNNQVVIDPEGNVRPHRFIPEPVFGNLADEHLVSILKRPELATYKNKSKKDTLYEFETIKSEMEKLGIELMV